ncbi:MAG: hypothetical protein U0X73_14810 [Thermoanaerobaculia bacterium]
MNLEPVLAVGATGNRDLRPEDEPRLAALVAAELDRLARRYPGTRRRIVSPLAEGADRWIARAGLAAGWPLVAVLPLPRAEYERDFATAASRAEFARLLAAAEEIEEPVELSSGAAGADAGARALAYRAAGDRVSALAAVMIALWNGVATAKPGGTWEVLERRGERPAVSILAPRASDPRTAGPPFTVRRSPADPEEFHRQVGVAILTSAEPALPRRGDAR